MSTAPASSHLTAAHAALLRFTAIYKHLGTTKEGCGGLAEQVFHQGLDSASIIREVKVLNGST